MLKILMFCECYLKTIIFLYNECNIYSFNASEGYRKIKELIVWQYPLCH